MLSDAQQYSAHRSFQNDAAKIFLKSTAPKMEWTKQEETVMDIGCGSGDGTRDLILPIIPRVKTLIGIDIIPEMIEFAKNKNTSDKIEYYVANIEKWETVQKWAQQISKVVSFFVFNWLKDQEQAFKNIFNILKPGGEAALLFALNTKFWDSYKLHIDSPKWSKYLQNADGGVPESHYKNYGAPYYRNMLKNIGFDVIICEDNKEEFVYFNDDECRESIFPSGLTKYIPDDLKNEFKEDLFQGFMKYNGRNSDGKPVFYHTNLSLLIRKPN